jgi:ADP-heptose:LPS heptosyltransferase
MENNPKKIIISRTDKIGDVILTLPMAGILKEHFPSARIIFLGRKLVQPIVETSQHIEEFIDWGELGNLPEKEQIKRFKNLNADVIFHVFPNPQIARIAQKAKIPLRIGTGHRIYHLWTCNKALFYSRKKSNLHESQLNLKLLTPLGIEHQYSTEQLANYYGMEQIPQPDADMKKWLSNGHFNLILHPKSKGSAREWGLDNFSRLIELLPKAHYKIFITGTPEEQEELKEFLAKHRENCTDLTGKLTMKELIAFINQVDGLVAASTGPLHIASALGKTAIGIFPPIRPMHPGRWAPIGRNAHYLVLNKECSDCRKTMDCHCIRSIKPEQVVDLLDSIVLKNTQPYSAK